MSKLPQNVITALEDFFQKSPYEVQALQGDASHRRYFRIVTSDNTYIWMDLTHCPEVAAPFVQMTAMLQNQAILCPKILLHITEGMLITDLGQNSLESEVLKHHHFEAYHTLQPVLCRLSQTRPKALPLFDDGMIQNELQLFTNWFLKFCHPQPISTAQTHFLQKLFDALSHKMLEQPQCLTHRDFHCRNIMLVAQQPYLIDYQDAVMGCITYDAVSLLKDCYLDIPRETALMHLRLFYDHLDSKPSWDEMIEWFDLTGLQRHLKVLGIFTRLKQRDHKPNYMQSVPRIIGYIQAVIEDHPHLKPLHAFMHNPEEVMT